jgi:hypothetical protein
MARKRGIEIVPCADPTVVAIDPGQTTGWSVMSVHPEALLDSGVSILHNILHWTHGQIVGPEDSQASEVLGIVDMFPGACVLIEDFILRTANAGREVLSPVRITAKIEYGLWLVGGVSYRQMPSEAKSVATDNRLKSWGFYQREGGLEHARDADRHALTWLRKCKQHEWMRRACWPYLFGEEGEFGSSSGTSVG